MTLTALAVFAGALAPIMPIGAVLLMFAVIAALAWVMFRPRPRAASGTFVGRHRTRDISFLAQSPSGFIGRVTRSVPAPRITPDPNDATNPVPYYGLAVMNTVNDTVRGILASDAGASGISGIAVAPYPFQQQSTNNYGEADLTALTAVPTGGIIDTMRTGSITAYCNSAQAPNAHKTNPVFVWCAASSGTHVQGGFETAASAAITATAKVGNTGNGTVTAGPTVTAGTALNGNYTVQFTDATHFDVIDPSGKQLQPGQTGVAYSDGGIGFTITAGGTAFAAGDQFTMAVAYNTIPVTNAYFNGPGDSTGAIELMYNL
jgi:hypothetical protein